MNYDQGNAMVQMQEADAASFLDQPEPDAHATWKPVVGQVFRPFKDSRCPHGPGMKFTPNGQGGGTCTWSEVVKKKGFRPKQVQRSIRKLPFNP